MEFIYGWYFCRLPLSHRNVSDCFLLQLIVCTLFCTCFHGCISTLFSSTAFEALPRLPSVSTDRMRSVSSAHRTSMCCYISGTNGGYLYQISPILQQVSSYKYTDKALQVSIINLSCVSEAFSFSLLDSCFHNLSVIFLPYVLFNH